MSGRSITKEQLDAMRESVPLSKLPPGFPRTHSRFPSTPSPTFIEAIQGATEYDPDEDPDAAGEDLVDILESRTKKK